MDSVNSTTFIKKPPCMTDTQEKFLYSKELLAGRIFLGNYLERRYVSELKEYRDVVVISSEETDLHYDLTKILKKWLGVTEIKWVGITGPGMVGFPKGFCFWVKLTNLAFGHYWFQIKHVKLVDGELVLQLKYIRKSHTPTMVTLQNQSINSEEKSTQFKNDGGESSKSEEVWDFDSKEAFRAFQTNLVEIIQAVWSHLTRENILRVTKVGCAFAIALVMGTVSCIGNLGDFILKLVHQLTLLVIAFTPIAIQLIDCFSKIIGGFYILICGMFFRNRNTAYRNRNYNRNNQFSIPYSSLSRTPPQQLPVDWRERNRILREELLSN